MGVGRPHSQHDQNQTSALASFVARLRYVQLRAAQLGLKDKLYVLVTSDFGPRTGRLVEWRRRKQVSFWLTR